MVLLVQKLSLAHQLSSVLENHHHHHHHLHHHQRRPSESNSASLEAFFHNLFSKLEFHHDHRHHHPLEANLASLQAFRSDVSNYLRQLSLEPKPGAEFSSLIWIQQCLELLPMVTKAFAKLLVEIDSPMSKWEASSIDEYLNYTLNLLENLNSISSSLSHLSQARLSLSHSLSLIKDSPSLALERFQEFQSKNLNTEFKVPRIEPIKERLCSSKEQIIHEAMADIKKIGSWVCGVVLSSLSSEINPHMEMRKSANRFVDSSLIAIDSCVSKEVVQKQGTVKEVREVNEAVDCLVSAIMANEEGDGEGKELKRRLEVFEKGLMDLKKEGDSLFSEVLATRNELLESLRNKSNNTT